MANLPPPPLQSWNALPRPWAQWFMLLWNRVGGATAASNDELQSIAPEDAGIEEIRIGQFQLADALGQMPFATEAQTFDWLAPPILTDDEDTDTRDGRIAALEAEVATLRLQIEAMTQGTVL